MPATILGAQQSVTLSGIVHFHFDTDFHRPIELSDVQLQNSARETFALGFAQRVQDYWGGQKYYPSPSSANYTKLKLLITWVYDKADEITPQLIVPTSGVAGPSYGSSSAWELWAGSGTGDKCKELNDGLESTRSFVITKTLGQGAPDLRGSGFMKRPDDDLTFNFAAHEFGHIVGLSDRYIDGLLLVKNQSPGTPPAAKWIMTDTSVPISKCASPDLGLETLPLSPSNLSPLEGYRYDSNLMTRSGRVDATLSNKQLEMVLTNVQEFNQSELSEGWVPWFDAKLTSLGTNAQIDLDSDVIQDDVWEGQYVNRGYQIMVKKQNGRVAGFAQRAPQEPEDYTFTCGAGELTIGVPAVKPRGRGWQVSKGPIAGDASRQELWDRIKEMKQHDKDFPPPPGGLGVYAKFKQLLKSIQVRNMT